jgi:hypothetical protein
VKVMEEFNIQGKQTSFYMYCPGTFEYILVHCDVTLTNFWINKIYNVRMCVYTYVRAYTVYVYVCRYVC